MLFDVPARGVRRRDLRQFALTLQQEVARGRDFVCLITSDEALRKWNRQFRKEDYPTDVLSFPNAHAGESAGELAISFDRAKAQAAEFGHAPEQEICILMLHGLLHLLGMDHERDGGAMARVERRWRRRYELPPGLIDRVKA